MTIRLAPEHRCNLQSETVISVIFNTVISGLFAWGLFHDVEVVPLWGGQGIVVDLVPTVFMITLALTIALTLITRGRIRKGRLPGAEPPRPRPARWLPANLALRADAGERDAQRAGDLLAVGEARLRGSCTRRQFPGDQRLIA